MKNIILIAAFTLIKGHLLFSQNINAIIDSARQAKTIDSLKKELAVSKPDSNRVKILKTLAGSDTVMLRQALELAEQIGHKRLQSEINRAIGIYSVSPATSLAYFLKALDISESINNKAEIARNNRNIGRLYNGLKDYTKARDYLFRALAFFREAHSNDSCVTLFQLGEMFQSTGRYDSALVFYQQAFKARSKLEEVYAARSLMGIGNVYAQQGDNVTAMKYMRTADEHMKPLNHWYFLAYSHDLYLSMAKIFQKTGHPDSSLFYAKQAFEMAQEDSSKAGMANAGKFLFEYYDGKNEKEAYKYLKIFSNISDSLNPVEKAQQVQDIAFQEDKRRQSIETARIASANRTRLYVVLGGLLFLLIIAIILFRNNRHKQKANELLRKQKIEIEEQRTKAEQALKELKTTQTQLIQSEKMASLGELTAGIAHEIQNPLNFVNNFSEVNNELLGEMNEEIEKGNYEEVRSIAKNVQDNEEKIIFHGKRADSIVKGMLQHSRNSSGQKELTDINALVDECLRLSYHGLRAKDKSFNAKTETDFDERIPKINIAAQDIGRVVLNLFTNAFYSVMQKKKQHDNYEPVISVRTAKTPGGISISIQDNGMGVPGKVLEKIFQPFFTTKPVGEGTGLGLSMSYDIITKGHEGELKVETVEGEFATFIINLPIKNTNQSHENISS